MQFYLSEHYFSLLLNKHQDLFLTKDDLFSMVLFPKVCVEMSASFLGKMFYSKPHGYG